MNVRREVVAGTHVRYTGVMAGNARDILWAEALLDDSERMPPGRAKALLAIKPTRRQIRRLGQLLELNREGKIAPDERRELEFLVQFGDFLAILQATARLSLKRTPAAAAKPPRRKTA